MEQSEERLVAELLDAPRKAEALCAEIQAQSLIRPGAKESEIDESVYALAASMCGISALLAQTHPACSPQHAGSLRRKLAICVAVRS